MYSVNFKNESKQINKFFLMNSSMAGEKALGVFDNEEDLSYYALTHHYYKTYSLSTVCSYTDLYDLEGKRISDKQLDTIIQKYFPEETKKIDKRRQLCNNKFIAMLMNFNNWKMIKYWTEYEEEIIKNFPLEKKNKLEEVETKSKQYIENFFGDIKETKKTNKNIKI